MLGVPPAEARRQALVSLGGPESARNHVRDARFAAALVTSWQELRLAVRGVVRRPLASTVAVATLSLGLASVTALFAVTDAVILQPVGDRDSRLVRIWKDDVERGGGLLFPISYPEYLVWKDEATSFDALSAINYADGATIAVLVDDEPVTALPVWYHTKRTQCNRLVTNHLGSPWEFLPAQCASRKGLPAGSGQPAASSRRSRSSAARCFASSGGA